jgi:hypothetical protein
MTGILKVDTIQKNDGSVPTAADLGLNVTGAVLQVVQTVMDDNLSYSTNSEYDIPGMAVTITPTSANSKFLISCNLHYAGGTDAIDDFTVRLRLKRNGSVLSYTQDGARQSGDYTVYKTNFDNLTVETGTFERLDEPNTSAELTYQVVASNGTWSTNPVMYNRSYRFDGASYATSRTRSTLTVMEIAG